MKHKRNTKVTSPGKQVTFGDEVAPEVTKEVAPEVTPEFKDDYAMKWAYDQYCIQQNIRKLPKVTYERYLKGDR